MQTAVAIAHEPVGRWRRTAQPSSPAKMGPLPTVTSVATPTPTSSIAVKKHSW